MLHSKYDNDLLKPNVFFFSVLAGFCDDWGPGALSGLWTPDYGYRHGRTPKLDLNKLQHIDFSLEEGIWKGNRGEI